MESERKHTDAELKQLAMDIADGKVFTSSHIPPTDVYLVSSIFMVIGLMAHEQAEAMKSVTLLYEYMNKAGDRSINGYPMFMSLRALERADHEKLNELHEAYLALKQGFADA